MRTISKSHHIRLQIAQAERRAREREEPTYKHPTEYQRGARCLVRHREPIPDEVIEEAVRAHSAPRTVTQIVNGDPLPGRSALDHALGFGSTTARRDRPLSLSANRGDS